MTNRCVELDITRKQFQHTPPVSVEVVSFDELTKRNSPQLQAYLQYDLALDNYQRPYVWDDVKIHQLINDLRDFDKKMDSKALSEHKVGQLSDVHSDNSPTASYYMGSLLLHVNEDYQQVNQAPSTRLCVIDGQQRLTSLSVLYFILNGKLPEHIDFHYRSPISAKHISKAKEIFLARKGDLRSDIFERLRFTIIMVEREDLAFTFFDTQNNRGVPLAATDLLKAFHLRAIDSENLQTHCARRWESVQAQGKDQAKDKSKHDFAPQLFHYFLWRSRNWRGSKVEAYENVDDMLHTFQTQTSSPKSDQQLTLYPGSCNQFAKTLTLLDNDEHLLELQSVNMSKQAAGLPFAIRQPIQRGVGFFLYAEKYASLLASIFDKQSQDPELKAFNKLYDDVVSQLSPYLTNLYRLAVLMYVDRLGYRRLFEFSLWLDHVIGAIRLEKYYVFQQAPINFLKDKKINLLDVIAFAYEPSEVIEYLQGLSNVTKQYQAENGWQDKIAGNEAGVKVRYVKALATFYGIPSLANKHTNSIDDLVKKHIPEGIRNV